MSGGNASYTQDNRAGSLDTALGKDKLLLLSMTATERLSESFTVTILAFSPTAQPIHTLLGTPVGVSFAAAPDPAMVRDFAGVLWEYVELGRDDHGYNYRLVLRPATDFLTLNKRNRIFQKKSATDIVKAVLGSGFKASLNGSYDPLEYCVQYQESDFAFVSRLMEYEGVYYYYAHAGKTHEMVLIDNANGHPDLSPATARVAADTGGWRDAPIRSVTERRGIGPAKVTVADYDFEAPDTLLRHSKSAAKVLGSPTLRDDQTGEGSAGAWAEGAELFEFPAKYTSKETARGEHYGLAWLDSHRRRMARSFADGSFFAAAIGHRVTLDHADGSSAEYLIVGTDHDYSGPAYATGGGEHVFRCAIELMPATEQYRPALATPRPRIMGPQTAIVVGPAGEEIHTDKYGRIKVQFFWDREGKKDENSGCFIRVVQSGAGQGWGSFALPRIGQEVVVEFLDGDPDRPLVTGAVYNGSNTVPEALPANQTQFGLKTRITKGGGGYNRLWFEDKKGSEVVWFRAERDYKVNIVNKDEERQYDKGHRKTTFMEGNDELVITKGTRTETIESHDKKTIKTGSLTDVVETGDETHTVKTGKRTTAINGDDALEVKTGNSSLAVKLGNIAVKADLGKITMEAMQSIELKVGGSSITIDQIGVKIKGTVMVEIKGVMVQTTADAMQTIKGGLVLIN